MFDIQLYAHKSSIVAREMFSKMIHFIKTRNLIKHKSRLANRKATPIPESTDYIDYIPSEEIKNSPQKAQINTKPKNSEKELIMDDRMYTIPKRISVPSHPVIYERFAKYKDQELVF